MKLHHGILTLAVAVAIAGCNSTETSTARDTQGAPDARAAGYTSNAPAPDAMNGVAGGPAGGPTANYPNGSSIVGMHEPLADNPQVGSNGKAAVLGLTAGDRRFITTALASGQYEVSACSKAATHSDNQQLKTMAQAMVDDHSKADDQLQAIATRKGLTTPIGITTDQIGLLAKLDQLNGVAFDNEFLTQQKKGHQDAIALFQAESTTGDAQDLRDWAAATLPTLRNHLDMINTLSGNNNLGMAQ